ncbi:glycosyltransferase [Intrasporangium sp. DVR]|uniref:glycosyltransferase n=1 Tax=Intrasporangium sp. DVR TaxID=3127867 RepID=UPI00313A67AA
MEAVEIHAEPLDALAELLEPERAELFLSTASFARGLLSGRIVWNINSTASGGGVAEMLQTLLAYARGAEVDTRWLVLEGDPQFFEITKALHNALHGSLVGRTGFDSVDQAHYERVMQANLAQLRGMVRPGDVVLLHDPQTAGLAAGLKQLGAHVVWRCHIGRDESTEITDLGWAFLRQHVLAADAFVFSRVSYIPDWVPRERAVVIQPSIDPFSTKNAEIVGADVRRILLEVGLVHNGDVRETFEFQRRTGEHGVLRRHADLVSNAPPPITAPLVVQVSRWDRLKDMPGVLTGFAAHVAPHTRDAHLVLAGPDVSGVSDDPEGAQVYAECRELWRRLPDDVRGRCHLASLPMDDVDENAFIVNALQRHAAIVVQKSLVEGFGLTLTEAMWKGRPVVASAVGGLQDQLTDGDEGLLLGDPADLESFGKLVTRLLEEPELRAAMGQRGQERVRRTFLGDRHLIEWVHLLRALAA